MTMPAVHRSYGNEQWEFDEHGLMRRREAASTMSRSRADRRFRWAAPATAADVPGLVKVRFEVCTSLQRRRRRTPGLRRDFD